ncbi:MAG: hypothetical protein HY320_08350, partial [Armatimonadetes bacterium]|nr:hypothetical protein [Armatimonadota bacterium]
QDPGYAPQPFYWVAQTEVQARLAAKWRACWLLAFRDITNATNERTAIFSLLPRTGVGHKAPLVFLSRTYGVQLSACFLANANSLVFDYTTRQKLGGTSLSYFVLKQLPVPPPDTFTSSQVHCISPRVLELVYTAWDIKPFADDLWREADGALKERLRQQWEENRAATGGHPWEPPEWAEIAADGTPLPPFRWDAERRAVLRAELDAPYARLYGLTRKQLRYILDPHGLSDRELEDILDPWEDPTCAGPHLLPAQPTQDFPGETFRVLKEKETAKYGEYPHPPPGAGGLGAAGGGAGSRGGAELPGDGGGGARAGAGRHP